MALVTCPDCRREVSDAAPACPGCGRPAGRPDLGPSPREGASESVQEAVSVGPAPRPRAVAAMIGAGTVALVLVVAAWYIRAESAARDQRAFLASNCPDLVQHEGSVDMPTLLNSCSLQVQQRKDEAVRNSQKAAREAQVGDARRLIAEKWATYDGLASKTKEGLLATVASAMSDANSLPKDSRSAVQREVRVASRERMAPLISPGVSASGEDMTTLLPAVEPGKCGLWASQWTRDLETLRAMISLGFRNISCPPLPSSSKQSERTWNLVEAESALDPDRVCFLYDDDDRESPVFIWRTLEKLRVGEMVGHETSTEAAMRMLALVDDGAQTVQPGARFVVQERGDGWFKISAASNSAPKLVFVNKWDDVGGYVPVNKCHSTR
jgi:hypothetical protein